MKPLLYILLSTIGIVTGYSRHNTDYIIADIEAFAQQQDTLSLTEQTRICQEWVDNIPQDELLAYAQQAEEILYPPYSTLNRRLAYRSILERLLKSSDDETAMMRYAYQYEMLCHNNEGDVATDFYYYDTEGNEHCLSQTEADYILLIFNDPECEECAALRKDLLSDKTITTLMDSNQLTVMAIFPDEATDEWSEQMMHYPTDWIKGYAEDVSDIYDLRTLPSTYLLDKDRTILLRNGTVETIIEAIK